MVYTNYVRAASTQTCQKTETKIVTENIDVGKAYHTRFACREFCYFLHKVLKMNLIKKARASPIQGQAIDESTDVAFVSAMIQYISHIKHGRVQRKCFAMLELKRADADTIFETAEASLMKIFDGDAEQGLCQWQ